MRRRRRPDFRKMKEVDLKLALQKGSPLIIDNIPLKPYTLSEIEEYGYTKYIENIQWLSLTVDDFIKYVDDPNKLATLMIQKIKLKPFDFLFNFGTTEDRGYTLEALSMVLRTDDIYLLDGQNNQKLIMIGLVESGVLKLDEDGEPYFDEELYSTFADEDVRVITRDNLEKIVEAVKIQNFLLDISPDQEDEFDPADEKARQIAERIKETRKVVEKIKREDAEESGENTIDFSDIIDAVSVKSNNLNKITIWDYNMYQLYRDLNRLELIDEYQFGIKALMAGSKNTKFKHWSSKI